MNPKFTAWSEQDTATAIEMLGRNAHDEEFRERLGRSKKAAESRKQYATSARYRELMRARESASYNPPRPREPAPELIVEADRALHEARSVTAWLLGDPAPSRSSLAKKLAEASV